MKKIECDQRSPEWLQARMGVPTASEMDNLITPAFALKDSAAVKTYVAKKLAEKWLGEPITTFTGGAMEQGNLKEEEAIPAYECLFEETIQRVGFLTTDDGRVGCSPDGLIGVGGIEVKCPEIHTHVKYLLAGEVPKDYVVQVHTSMFVTGAPWWKFMSYFRGLPKLILTVNRDEAIIATIQKAADTFGKKFDEGWKRLIELNDGPPTRKYISTMDENDAVTRTLEGVSQSAMAEFLNA